MSCNNMMRACISCVVLLTVRVTLSAQPYLYYIVEKKDLKDERSYRICRLDMQTNVVEDVASAQGRALSVFCTGDPNRIILQSRTSLELIDIRKPGERRTILENMRFVEVLDLVDAEKTNRLYISLGSEHAYDHTVVFDRITMDSVASLKKFMSFHKPFLSNDEQRFFRFIPDTTGIFFNTFVCSDESLVQRKVRCGSLGNFAFEAGFDEGKRGVGIARIRFHDSEGFLFQEFVVCRPDQGSVGAIIPFPWRAEAHLSSDAKYVIIEEVQFVDDPRPDVPAEFRPGSVYVFESSSGRLVRHLRLPAQGNIYVFDAHPNKFYYYIPAENRSIPVLVPNEISASDQLDDMVSLKHQAVTNHWLGDEHFVRELDNELANAQKHLARDDSVNCRKELEIFQQKLKHEFERKAGKGEKRFVTEEGYALLYFNALYLIERLPERR